MRLARARCGSQAAIAAFVAVCAIPAAAQDAGLPTPKAVIYPGDVIRDDMLADVRRRRARRAGAVRRVRARSSSARWRG